MILQIPLYILFIIAIVVIFIILSSKSTTKSDLTENEISEITNNSLIKPYLLPENTTEPFIKNGVIIANKKHPLPKDYAPGESKEAVTHLRELINDAQSAGNNVTDSWSGYRDYATQETLFNSYSAENGLEKADLFSARPGFSEHQTGFAFDLRNTAGHLYRQEDPNYNYKTDWIANNCAKYGFIVRYRNEWKDFTGYIGEPWHLRYLGVDLAQKVFASGKPLEEYLDVEGGDYIYQ